MASRTARTLVLLTIPSIVATIAAPALAQPAPVGTGVIVGRVVDADAGTPISGVLIVALGASPASGTRPPAMLTDPQGGFVFRNLPRGSYTLTASVGGNGFSPSGFLVTGVGHQVGAYLNGGYGQRRPDGPLQSIDLDEGEGVADAVIRLWKGGSITGHVVDEAGEPLVDMVVAAVRRGSDGRLQTGPTAKTDDRGMYRLGTLTPGEYVVVVPQTQLLMPSATIEALLSNPPDPAGSRRFASVGAPAPPAGGLRFGSSMMVPPDQSRVTNALPPPPGEVRHVYQSTFYPSAHTAARATPVTVRSGQERSEINVQLQPVRGVPVSGTLLDENGPVVSTGVRLMPTDSGDGSSVLEVATAVTDGGGVFSFPLVPLGSYTLMARRTSGPGVGGPRLPGPQASAGLSAWATQPLTVGEAPVRDVVLMLRPGFQISGRVEFQGSSGLPGTFMKQFSIVVTPVPPLSRTAETLGSAPIAASGEFAIRGVPPGRYVLTIRDFPETWSLQSVTHGTREMTDALLTISDEDVGQVAVVFTDRPAVLEGTVSAANAADLDRASVFVFPTDTARWADSRSSTRVFRTVRVSRSGTFSVSPMIAGEYFVVAAAEELAGEWPDARLLAKLAPLATTVRIDHTQRQTVALRLAGVR